MIPKWREIGLLVSYPSSEGYKAQASKHGTATLPVSCVDELYRDPVYQPWGRHAPAAPLVTTVASVTQCDVVRIPQVWIRLTL